MNRCLAVFLGLILFGGLFWSDGALGQQSNWDAGALGVSKDWFDQGTNAKNHNTPTSRLKKLTECTECQGVADRLEALLDAWYLAEFQAGSDLQHAGMGDDSSQGTDDQKQGSAMQAEARAGLGGLTAGEIRTKIKQAKKKTDPAIPQGNAALAGAIKEAAAALAKCLADCKAKAAAPPQPGTVWRSPDGPGTPPPEGPGTAPPPAAGPKPDKLIEIDFVINRGAEVTPEEIDEALKKVNEAFAKSGVGFSRKTTTPANDPNIPEVPENAGADKASKEQNEVAGEAEKVVKGLPNPHGVITIKIVENFHDADNPNHSAIQGITIGRTIIVADPFHIGKNTMGREPFSHVLTHELGHRLGLGHNVLPSDKDYPHQTHGHYDAPNAMSPEYGGGTDPDEFTPDQIEVIKKNAALLLAAPPPNGGALKSLLPGFRETVPLLHGFGHGDRRERHRSTDRPGTSDKPGKRAKPTTTDKPSTTDTPAPRDP
jgi:hypothetical protein